LTGLPNVHQLEQFVQTKGARKAPFSILFIDIVGLKQLNTRYGRAFGDDTMRHVVRHATEGLRVADILFRYSSDEFVALLIDTDTDAATAIGERIETAIRGNAVVLGSDQSLVIDVEVAAAAFPADGDSLDVLINAARSKGVASRRSKTR